VRERHEREEGDERTVAEEYSSEQYHMVQQTTVGFTKYDK